MKKWIKIISWSLLSILTIVLLVSTNSSIENNTELHTDILLHIEDDNPFLTKKEIRTRLENKHLLFEGQKLSQVNVEAIEKFIQSISHVKTVQVFTRINGQINIQIDLKKPIARIINKSGQAYYLDDQGSTMAISNLHTARSIVFTGEIIDQPFTYNYHDIINNDSLKSIQSLDEIYRISNYVCNDPFFQALIGQVHREKNGDFIVIPLVGDQKINFGTAESAEEVAEKFNKLKTFYKEAVPYEGWNTYSEITLKYKNQIVCKKK